MSGQKPALHQGNLLVLLAVAGLLAAYAWFVYLPATRTIQGIRAEAASKRLYIQQAAQLPLTIQNVQQEIENTEAFNKAWADAAPKLSELSKVFGQIGEAAKDAATTTTRFCPEPTTTRTKIAMVPLSIGVTGSFAEICAFVHAIETMPQAIWVDSLKMSATGKDGESVLGEISMVVFANNSEESDYVRGSGKPIN